MISPVQIQNIHQNPRLAMVMSRVFNPMSLRKICVGVFANNQAGDYASSMKAEKLFQRRVIRAMLESGVWARYNWLE
ncbi:hypothetical protein DN052_13805 [Acidithiobacillus ferrooxidans]|uniref:Uncharacterized protein n=1 Tax=Acidithiobacillus ferrooxidans TaxID=920 RepID=A0A2W1KLG9_ACIFR|nr:hypothetical protein DN052_13805 [Acidithiobacillus ferrooxidans]